jgi:hypothetical protein
MSEIVERLRDTENRSGYSQTMLMAADCIEQLEAELLKATEALKGIALAVPIGPYGELSTWKKLAYACQQTAREAREALAAATGTAKTLQAAECEASQSGPQGQRPHFRVGEKE